jgi:hypothetical protein
VAGARGPVALQVSGGADQRLGAIRRQQAPAAEAKRLTQFWALAAGLQTPLPHPSRWPCIGKWVWLTCRWCSSPPKPARLRRRRALRVRADAYCAARLLDLGLTAWASHWAEGHELRQRAALFREKRWALPIECAGACR